MRTFSHWGENFFSKAGEYFENIATCIMLYINQIAVQWYLSYACCFMTASNAQSLIM